MKYFEVEVETSDEQAPIVTLDALETDLHHDEETERVPHEAHGDDDASVVPVDLEEDVVEKGLPCEHADLVRGERGRRRVAGHPERRVVERRSRSRSPRGRVLHCASRLN